MQLDDMIMVSIDDHVIEPPDLFERHMPAKYKAQAPKLVRLPDGSQHWRFAGDNPDEYSCMRVHGGKGLHRCFPSAVASLPKPEWIDDAMCLDEMRPGCYDIHARVGDMNAAGVLSSMCFPSFPGFAGTHMSRGQGDPELAAITAAAYNDWHIDEWCAEYPGRFIPLALAPADDPKAIVAEIHRVAAKGCTAITLPETPYAVGLPPFTNDFWDPVFRALSDTGVVMCAHIGPAYHLLQIPEEVPHIHATFTTGTLSMLVVTDLFVSGALKKYPDLRVAVSEGGIGWIPFFLDKWDRLLELAEWAVTDDIMPGGTATEIWRKQFLGCVLYDPATLHLARRIGIESIAWEQDYPHSDCTWPNGADLLLPQCEAAGLTDDEINKLTYENACRFFRFDPFEDVPKANATVGALRKQAAVDGVDISITSKEIFRQRYAETHAG